MEAERATLQKAAGALHVQGSDLELGALSTLSCHYPINDSL